MSGQGDFQERRVVRVRQGTCERQPRDDGAAAAGVVKQVGHKLAIELKARPVEHLTVLGEETGVEAESQLACGEHADDLGTGRERRKQPRDQDIRVEHDIHLA